MTGYASKRAAARDKLLDDDDDLTIAYLNGVYDGKKAAQPAQEPVAWADLQKEAQQIVESKFLWKKFIDGTPLSNDIACWMADFAQQYTTPPQPVQEPVAYLCKPDQHGLFAFPTPDKACKDCFPVYTAPPQPKQEPVANDRALQLVTYQMNHWRAYALELQERLVKYEGGAPMLLNKENT